MTGRDDLTRVIAKTFDRGVKQGHRDAITTARRLFPSCDVDALAVALQERDRRQGMAK